MAIISMKNLMCTQWTDLPKRMGIAGAVLGVWLTGWMLQHHGWSGHWWYAAGLSGLATVVCTREWFVMVRGSVMLGRQRQFFFIFGTGGILLAGGCLGFVLCQQGWHGLIMAVLADTVAYFAGKLLGGPKLCVRISPGKTWSGAISAWVACALWGLICYTPYTCPVGQSYGAYLNASILGLCFCWAAQGGDLLESWAKRKCGAKDSGTCLPGHGGMLDRLDSWLAVSVLMVLMRLTPWHGWLQ